MTQEFSRYGAISSFDIDPFIKESENKKRQLEAHTQQMKAWAEQAKKADSGVELLNVIKASIKAVETGAKTAKTVKEWNDPKYKRELEKQVWTADDAETRRRVLLYETDRKAALGEDYENYEELIGSISNPNLRNYLRNLSGRQEVLAKEFYGTETANNLNALFEKAKQNENFDAEFAQAEAAGNGQTFKINFAKKQLAAYNLKDGLVAKSVIPIYKKWAKTSDIKSSIVSRKLEKDDYLFQLTERLKTFSKLPAQDTANFIQEEINARAAWLRGNRKLTPLKEGETYSETEIQEATKDVRSRLHILAERNDISLGKGAELLTDSVQLNVRGSKKPFTLPKAFFDKDGEQFNSFIKSLEKGANAEFEVESGKAEQTMKNLISQRNDDEISAQDFDAQLVNLENEGWNIHKPKLWKQLQALKGKSAIQTANDEALWKPRIREGLYGITQEDINGITDSKLKKEVQTRFDQIEATLKDVPDHKNTFQSTIHAASSKIPWADVKSLTPTAKLINNEIDRAGQLEQARLVYEQYDDQGRLVRPNPNIAAQVIAYKENLWLSKGGGTVGGNGLYSTDKSGKDFLNYKTAQNMKRRVEQYPNIKATTTNIETWDKDINTIIKANTENGQINIAGIINSGVFDEKDIAATFEYGDYSEKMEYIASNLNIDIDKLFKGSLEAVSKNNKEFAARWGITNLDKIKPSKRQEISEVLDYVFKRYEGNQDEKYQLHDLKVLMKKGWKNLSNNQKQRVFETLRSNETLSNKAKAVAEEASTKRIKEQIIKRREQQKLEAEKNKPSNGEVIQQQLTDLGIGFDPEKFNLEWDDTNKEWKIRIKE